MATLLGAILILILGFILAGWAKRRIRGLGAQYDRLDPTLFNFLGNLARYTILAFVAIFVLNKFGLQTTSMVAALGAAGLAIGLALQGTLSNVAAGVMLILFRPIKDGDFVEVERRAGDGQGHLAELHGTGLDRERADHHPELRGLGQHDHQLFGLRSAPRRMDLRGRLRGRSWPRRSRSSETPSCPTRARLPIPNRSFRSTALGDWSVDFLVRVWVKASDNFAFQADMKRAVKEALDAAGIDIPFPTRTIITDAA